MSSELVIEVKDLRKRYGNGLFSKGFEALKGISFAVGEGEIFGLLGPNGAGKTTCVKLLLGIVRKSEGEAQLLGKPVGDRKARREIGYLPENLVVPRHHTGFTALELYGRMSGLSYGEVKARRGDLLDSVGLRDWGNKPVRKYSKGMRQRLGLAQALLHDPKVLFLDEPTDGLDPVGRNHVKNVLFELKRQGKTIFLNSHLLDEVQQICDRVAILDQGILRRLSTVDELLADQQAQGIRVQLDLEGPEGVIQSLLAHLSATLNAAANGRWHATLEMADQAQVDQLVDDLRAAQVSIVRLQPERLSLEDAFLRTLEEEHA